MSFETERGHFAFRIREVINALSYAARSLSMNSNMEAGYVQEKARELSTIAQSLAEFEREVKNVQE